MVSALDFIAGALVDELVSPEEIADAEVLRAAAGRCAAAAVGKEPLPARDVATINSFAGDEPPVPVLRADGSCVHTAVDPARAALAAIARDAIYALSESKHRLRLCDGCGAIFTDRSRSGKRRWCSMNGCGNRAKVAAYRRRRVQR